MAETENSKDLISVLWRGADILRSKMDANEYKDYLLGIVFYKYLSDSFLIKVYDLIYDDKPESLKIALNAYKEVLQDECAEELTEQIKSECHYVIEPDLTYTCFADAARNNSFNREQLQKAFNNIEQSDPLFGDLFADIDLYSNRLGTGDQKQSDTISSLIKEIDKADLLNSDAEILGNAYEYLIGQFASETGKKAGEFYTPQAVSKILTKIAIAGQEDKKGLSVYDPCMGSGSLLLNAKKYSKEPDYIKYYGQELNTSTYNLARMNMFLHGVVPENQKLRNGDTLDGDWPTDEETDFNMVLMNPPYSAKWSATAGFLQDERFSDYGVLAPKSKADYAFLLHGLYHLKNNGTMYRNSANRSRYSDKSIADYYQVIKGSKLAGFPAVIVEHAYVSNPEDCKQFLGSADKLRKLGAADAMGIADYLGLVKNTDPEFTSVTLEEDGTVKLCWEPGLYYQKQILYRRESGQTGYTKVAAFEDPEVQEYVDTSASPGITYEYLLASYYTGKHGFGYTGLTDIEELVIPAQPTGEGETENPENSDNSQNTQGETVQEQGNQNSSEGNLT